MVQAIRGMQTKGIRALQPKRELQAAYNKKMQEVLATRVSLFYLLRLLLSHFYIKILGMELYAGMQFLV